MASRTSYEFPNSFVWGVAAAAAQLEGASKEDGKSESIWDRFATIPGKIKNGDTPAIACDHYHRYEADFDLMKSLGIKHYRLSIAWPRVIPDGVGPVNEKGLAFYDRLIDALLERGITPWVTLFHWDLPQSLEDKGGWTNRVTADAFRPYAEAVTKRLGDRVSHWFTVNEIPCFIGNGYDNGYFAPGRREPRAVVNQAYHHALLAHGHGVKAVREFVGGHPVVGLVHNHLPAPQIPATETDADIKAAQTLYERTNRQLMAPLFLGLYTDAFLRDEEANAPAIQPGDLELISQPTDFLGLNIYAGDFVRSGADGKPEILPWPKGYPTGDLWWLKMTPQSLYWGIRHANEVYGVKSFYITESGAAFPDEVTPKGEILDLDRQHYLRTYLTEVHRAAVEGFDVKGYFLWSFLDNFEWAEGYEKRFGVVHVDYTTQKRTPKQSAKWYSEVARLNRLV